MRSLSLAVVGITALAMVALADVPQYLVGPLTLPEGAVQSLPERAQALEIPFGKWTADGLVITGAEDETELLAGRVYLLLDGDFFLLAMQSPAGRTAVRGSQQATLIAGGDTDVLVVPPQAFFELLDQLGLLPAAETIELESRDVPLKLPRAPEGSALDSVLWALVQHPNWIGFARDYGLQRVGLRVRVVAETQGQLAARFEPYIQSSSDGLTELLIPIPLLPALGEDPAASAVRPPYLPHPAAG
ncbi:MAG: hypothetical protein ACP5G2_07020 [Candidatus Bipolaricaulaceae bacterium]